MQTAEHERDIDPVEDDQHAADVTSKDGREVILSVKDLTVAFGSNVVLDALNLDIYRGEILGFVGPSGTGKSVLMRTVLRLLPRRSGSIEILGSEYDAVSEEERVELDTRLGVLFQHGALFSSLTVKENIQVPMREYLDLPQEIMDDLARLKIELVGLAPEAADKFPSELSGGMIKRAALARALALDPDLVFLDEPTSGLDPIGAAEFDELIARLRDTLGLTVYMVTHDLDSLFSVCDRIAVLGKKKVMVQGTIEDMLASDDEWVQSYFRGKRARSIVRDETHDLHRHDTSTQGTRGHELSGHETGGRETGGRETGRGHVRPERAAPADPVSR